MFDEIYWTFIDGIYYGPFTSVEDRLHLLDDEDRGNIDTFVKGKMMQEKGVLDEHYSMRTVLDL